MTGTCAACLYTNQSRSYLNHLVIRVSERRYADSGGCAAKAEVCGRSVARVAGSNPAEGMDVHLL
jgi:hypothetical protein